MCSSVFVDSAGNLPSRWAWIGQCLLDVGFAVSARSLRLVARLADTRRKVRAPGRLRLLHVTHDMYGFDAK